MRNLRNVGATVSTYEAVEAYKACGTLDDSGAVLKTIALRHIITKENVKIESPDACMSQKIIEFNKNAGLSDLEQWKLECAKENHFKIRF